jgi:hypothetical protein
VSSSQIPKTKEKRDAHIYLSRVTQDDIHRTANSTINGADGWAEKAIAGRGIFIDYESWMSEKNLDYNAMSGHAVPLEHITSIMKERGIVARPGDIFLLRTGTSSSLICTQT